MRTWKTASSYEELQFKAISDFLVHRPQLVEFLFHPTQPKLNSAPADIYAEIGGFCTSDQVLLRLALNIWCGFGSLSIQELFYLDAWIFGRVLDAIKMLGPKERVGSIAMQRFSLIEGRESSSFKQ